MSKIIIASVLLLSFCFLIKTCKAPNFTSQGTNGIHPENNGFNHTRQVRSPKWSGLYRGHHRHTKKKDLMIITVMPSGYVCQVTAIPTTSLKKKCNNRSKYTTLHPRSKEFTIVSKEMQNTIVKLDNCESGGGCFDHYNIIKIQKVNQGCAWRRFQTRKRDLKLEMGSVNEQMLFHGTDAVEDIVSSGFDERYASTNGQFGAGLYFAKHSSLANQFIFGYFGGNGCPKHHNKNCYICERQMLLCRVILGRPKELTMTKNMAHPPPGFDSVLAVPTKSGFRHPEYIVYRGEQAYPEYVITYKIVKPKKFHDDREDKHYSSHSHRNY